VFEQASGVAGRPSPRNTPPPGNGDHPNEEACDPRGPRHGRTRAARPGDVAQPDAPQGQDAGELYPEEGRLPRPRHADQPDADPDPGRRDDRYSGNVVVDVKKANHGAPKGQQTFTLTDAKVKFHVPDRTNDGKRNLADLLAGDRVNLHGKITKLRHGCSTTGFTPTITVKKVDFNKPKPPKPATPHHQS
jgi:hypothetical protein